MWMWMQMQEKERMGYLEGENLSLQPHKSDSLYHSLLSMSSKNVTFSPQNTHYMCPQILEKKWCDFWQQKSGVRRDPNDGPNEDVVGWKHSGVRVKWKHEVLGKLLWSGSDGQILIFVFFSGSISLCVDMDSRMLLT